MLRFALLDVEREVSSTHPSASKFSSRTARFTETSESAHLTDPAAACACDCACERDRHLFCPGPKRILSLDGGGVRGAISVAFLERIEAILGRRFNKQVLLGHWFDLIGGTSTGGIIGGALALGFTVEDVRRFYHEFAPKVFVHPLWRIMGLLAKFDAEILRHEIENIVGKCTLGSDDLITGFSVVSKRMDTGSTWILANNKRSRYWEARGAVLGNKDYPLANLVRASTAAPFYFDPEKVEIAEARDGMKAVTGLFVDGGVTPHNNPSLVLYLMALLDAYKLRWKAGPENLTIVSIGTGTHRDRLVPNELGMGKTAKLTYRALTSVMNDIHEFALTQMQYLGETMTPWYINRELGTMVNEKPPHGKMFRFIRYDVRLELDWINESDERRKKIKHEFGRELTETDMIRLRSLDDTSIIKDLYKLGSIAAEEQVKEEHWDGALAQWCNGQQPCAKPRYLPPPQDDRSEESLRFRTSTKITEALSYARAQIVRLRSSRHPSR